MVQLHFLGIAGLITHFNGYDGFVLSRLAVAYLTVLLVVAEPLRNAGSTRWLMSSPTVFGRDLRQSHQVLKRSHRHSIHSISFPFPSFFVHSIPSISFHSILIFIPFLSILTMRRERHHRPSNFPGLKYKPPYGCPRSDFSGPLVWIRDGGFASYSDRVLHGARCKTARISVVWAMGYHRSLYILTTFPFGARNHRWSRCDCEERRNQYERPSWPGAYRRHLLCFHFGNRFATILAVVAGLTISASGSFAHDFWVNGSSTERKPPDVKKFSKLRSRPLWSVESRFKDDLFAMDRLQT